MANVAQHAAVDRRGRYIGLAGSSAKLLLPRDAIRLLGKFIAVAPFNALRYLFNLN